MASFSTASFIMDALVCGETLTRSGVITGPAGQLKRGQVLTFASGKWAVGGANPAMGILAADCDASGTGDIPIIVYTQGKFKADQCIGLSAAVEAQLQDTGVYIDTVVNAVGVTVRTAKTEEAYKAGETALKEGKDLIAETLAAKEADEKPAHSDEKSAHNKDAAKHPGRDK